VASIGHGTFLGCESLVNVTLPHGVTTIGDNAFMACLRLTSVSIPVSVTSIGENAFRGCSSLKSLTIPQAVTYLGNNLWTGCASLDAVYFGGNTFTGNDPRNPNNNWCPLQSGTVYYLPGTTGWGATFGGRPTQLLSPQAGPSGLVSNKFKFRWTNTGSIPLKVERATSLSGSWTTISSDNMTGEFIDESPPAGKAFYRAAFR
jgi:hypothetical protein